MTRLLHIADLHFGDEDEGLVQAFLSRCAELEPDVVVAAGDFTQSGRRREFQAAARFFSALDAPVVGIPGNHDTPVRALHERFLRPWRRFDRTVGPHVQPRLALPDLQIEGLLSARRAQWQPDWSLGRINPRRLEPVLASLDKADTHVTRALTCHHPILAPGGTRGRARTFGAARALSRIAASCDMVLTGHLHESFALPVRATGQTCWFIGASTTFSRRTRDSAAGFNCIDVEPDGLMLTVYEADARRPRFNKANSTHLAR